MNRTHRTNSVALWVVAMLAISGSAGAHHSTRASYDMDRVLELSGVVTDFRFRNPHSQLFFDVIDENGNVTEQWVVELNSPGSWIRAGWDQQVFTPGDKVSFKMHPSRSGAKVGFPESITLEDGTVVNAAGATIGSPSE